MATTNDKHDRRDMNKLLGRTFANAKLAAEVNKALKHPAFGDHKHAKHMDAVDAVYQAYRKAHSSK